MNPKTAVLTQDHNLEKISGIIERVTFFNEQNGWSVLKVMLFRDRTQLVTVVIHQAQVYAGATMEFHGQWVKHPKFGEQFKAVQAIEKKPASAAALEKYLGSGLIFGVGPVTAKRIVSHFKERTLEVFENDIDRLLRVPGIAEKKLHQIKESWQEHRAIRDVMLFLQGYGISTLFATKIYKTYGDKAIAIVSENPYRLAYDIYGIGFFSADKIALSMGFERTGEARLEAGIRHVLAASREEGHCYLTDQQIVSNVLELLNETLEPARILSVVQKLVDFDQIKVRDLTKEGQSFRCYYSKSLYFDELKVAQIVESMVAEKAQADSGRILDWVERYCQKEKIELSPEQKNAVCEIPFYFFSILTGGPGCGKTTCTRVLVELLRAMRKRVVLAAPTGRAAQRMTEVMGFEAKTLHRLLEWAPERGGFKKDEHDPIQADFVIIDETSMLDISLAASLLKAVPPSCQILMIGDPDQLPSVGAGSVLADLLASKKVKRYSLTKVFRQAQSSSIIRFAHQINSGKVPEILSPFAEPRAFHEGVDCLFVDSEEATQDQARFLFKAKRAIEKLVQTASPQTPSVLVKAGEDWLGRLSRSQNGIALEKFDLAQVSEADLGREPDLVIPEKLRHIDFDRLASSGSRAEELLALFQKVHPWSSLYFGLTALDTVRRLYTKTIPEWLGKQVEVQVLTPQVRGSLGTQNLNEVLQAASNPESEGKRQLRLGSRLFREGDRVIQTRNNYDLNVFNGDIGFIRRIDLQRMGCEVEFSGPEARVVQFSQENLTDLSLAYAITIHKSQGSEFQAVIIPVLGQHFNMLYRNLIYTGLTRAKKLAIFVGSRRSFARAIHQVDNRHRQTALTALVDGRP